MVRRKPETKRLHEERVAVGGRSPRRGERRCRPETRLYPLHI